ncbi:hypothetical protein BU17DRAFT_59841 [Hysterangium stoloniferum]|nr:hypothetical protein BU17DRAFT_59841 [Hysterangium stoloniferum]
MRHATALALAISAFSLQAYGLPKDLCSFPDDVGAFALANTFQYCGKARILGVVSGLSLRILAAYVSLPFAEVNSRYAVPAMDAINTWYCHPGIPFARNHTLTNETAEPNVDPAQNPVFVTTLADPAKFPQSLQDNSIKLPLDFYRETLSKAKDHSITILGIGFMQNLDALYHSPGGKELIQRKVRELVVQGGDFGPNFFDPGPNRAGYNLAINITAAKVLEEWPSPVTFLGSNIGRAVITGQVLEKTPANNPVRVAYEIYHNGTNVENGSWDLLATYFGVLGLKEGSFQYGNANRGGRIEVFANATAGWNYNVTVPFQRRQHFLDFKQTNVTIANKVDALLSQFGNTKPPCLHG